jgi:hypothetical protein
VRSNFVAVERFEELQLLSIPTHDPRETSRPCCERGVSLLGVWAPVLAVVDVEDALMSHAAPNVRPVPFSSVINVVFGRRLCVFEKATEKRNSLVVFSHHLVAQLVSHRKCPKRTNGV